MIFNLHMSAMFRELSNWRLCNNTFSVIKSIACARTIVVDLCLLRALFNST